MAPDAGLNFARRILVRNGLDAGLAEKILGLITHPEHSDFFGADSQAEVSIGSLLPDGQRITERIDRLVVRDNDILVLDYKTDWNVPDALNAEHPHVMQLAGYARTLGQAYGGKAIRAAILWTACRVWSGLPMTCSRRPLQTWIGSGNPYLCSGFAALKKSFHGSGWPSILLVSLPPMVKAVGLTPPAIDFHSIGIETVASSLARANRAPPLWSPCHSAGNR